MTESFESLISGIDLKRLPRHVAMIMDGNGRWAKTRGLPRSAGHSEGVATVRRVTEFSSDLGIKYLTLYAFSTENWNRPQQEVDTLMYLIGWAIEKELPDLLRNNVRIHLIGDIQRIPEEARNKLLNCAAATSHCTGLQLSMCLSYSSRWEITRAASLIAKDALNGNLSPDEISEEVFNSYLHTAQTENIPDVDLLIRTGGEVRISNFLLWQLAYAELFFSPLLWPEFSKADYAEAIRDFQNRERRFGKTGDQVNQQSSMSDT
ncbi:MAG: isoprenyl transferase [Muribaculaceae bacterium]|nr:isoprenyl transferase [Muribaculaceae bacterium]